ncbi:MAG: hypothetical protein MJA83_11530 [Gammaproteobacteria bacterium]|nr:hypothetical protein [Gammaproteobacteria bacterium]
MYKKIVMGILFLFFSCNYANAAGTYNGNIVEVWVNDPTRENVGWIKTTGGISGTACTDTEWFILDLTAAGMKEALAFALSAYLAGKTVHLKGAGTCLDGYEHLKSIALR